MRETSNPCRKSPLACVSCVGTRAPYPRDVLFDGYTDALSVKLMNKQLAKRNLTIECSSTAVIEWNMHCRPVYDGDCTDTGFKVQVCS